MKLEIVSGTYDIQTLQKENSISGFSKQTKPTQTKPTVETLIWGIPNLQRRYLFTKSCSHAQQMKQAQSACFNRLKRGSFLRSGMLLFHPAHTKKMWRFS